MKTNFYTLFVASLLVITVAAQQKTTSVSSVTNDKRPVAATDNWYAGASEIVQQMEFDFYQISSHRFRVANSANRIGFLVDEHGYTVHSMNASPDQKGWEASFQVQSIHKNGSNLLNGKTYIITKKPNNIAYLSGVADLQYENSSAGMRQNFIVREKPDGAGALKIEMNIQSDLTAQLSAGNRLFLHAAGNADDVKLIYEDLKVWDANDKTLAAHMELDENNTLSIIVDDHNAVYPVTVDPLNKAAEWTTSANGLLPSLLNNLQLQVQTLYGYTVAGLGDINGDGYDDVAISAPGMADVVSGSGSLTSVGAVFVYLGSPTGLPTTPSKVLQPNTAVTGALFGFSIDAGDITGDGKNDIVISAPLDRYQTTASGLLGDVSVNVTAGKVYIYRSEDLLNSPNPTNFLQVRLQGTGFFSSGLLGNSSIHGLFGYAVAVADDLNSDGKADLIVGSPAYVGVDALSVQNGAAFIFYSNNLTGTPVQLDVPAPNLLGLPLFPLLNTSGLLFGFSVDGVGDYNMDGRPDIVVGAPAGADLSSLAGIFSGQVLGGSAYVYYGRANGSGINPAIGAKLQAASSGLLSNAANLFGYKVKGARGATGAYLGNIIVSAPAGNVLSEVLNGLRVKAGQLHVFVKSATLPASPTTPVVSTQTLSSPRSSSILSILAGQNINVSLLYGASVDNMLDANCDNIGDIIVGEPLSTTVPLLGANLVGGAAYVYLGQANGTYVAAPTWQLTTTVSPLLGVNATSLVGFSVAGAKYSRGRLQGGVRGLVGGPSNTLDFGSGLLNLGNTLGTTMSFVADNNGLGKSYSFSFTNCNVTLPANVLDFTREIKQKQVELKWTTAEEVNVNYYELQRSVDGNQFETIAMVFGKGDARNEYMYTDKRPAKGLNHYRLRIVDNDSKAHFSSIVTASFNEQLPGDVVVAPNPVTGSDIKIRMVGMTKGVYKMELMSTTGQVLQTKSVNVNQYDQQERITRTSNMPAGIYWLNMYDDSQNRVKTMRVFIMNNE